MPDNIDHALDVDVDAAIPGLGGLLVIQGSLSLGQLVAAELIEEAADVIVVSARNWIPINVLSMVMAGATSPISVSGALVTHNAEVLSGIVLAQATNPGAPVIYGSSSTTFDMRYGTAVVGVPEMAMISAGAAELSNFYGIPSYVAGG